MMILARYPVIKSFDMFWQLTTKADPEYLPRQDVWGTKRPLNIRDYTRSETLDDASLSTSSFMHHTLNVRFSICILPDTVGWIRPLCRRQTASSSSSSWRYYQPQDARIIIVLHKKSFQCATTWSGASVGRAKKLHRHGPFAHCHEANCDQPSLPTIRVLRALAPCLSNANPTTNENRKL